MLKSIKIALFAAHREGNRHERLHFLDSLAHAEGQHEALLGKMMLKVPQIAADAGLTNGFKTQINTGKGGGQEVFHLHIHILGQPAH